jgi:low temperature requirement protein LtrA
MSRPDLPTPTRACIGARDPDEPHRVATPLELLFDLVTVIAVASAAAGLHHAIAAAHITEGLLHFGAAFFGIWWAWMNYTWFASAYDNDDTLFRLLTMLIMGGALTMAAGISVFFDTTDLSLIVFGYIAMRIGMVMLWLRAARHDPARRATNRAYAAGIALAQLYWVALLLLQARLGGLFYPAFALGAVLELAVPAVAERWGMTPWHRHHIMERYGLLTIIMLGETLLAGSMALNQVASEQFSVDLVMVALSALVILFSMWWLYFAREEHLRDRRLSVALIWGYGHILIFMSAAAVGAGFAVLVDIVTGHTQVGLRVGDYAVAIPVSAYLLGLWLVRDRCVLPSPARWVLVLFAVLILCVPAVFGLEGVAVFTALCVWTRNRLVAPVTQPVSAPGG